MSDYIILSFYDLNGQLYAAMRKTRDAGVASMSRGGFGYLETLNDGTPAITLTSAATLNGLGCKIVAREGHMITETAD